MLGRITNQQMLVSSQRNLTSSRALLAQLQEQASSGRAVTKPSDDPSATASIMRLRSEQRSVTQYGTNISDGLAWMSTVDNALTNTEDLLRQARELTLRGANSGVMTPATREAIATQLDGVKADLLQQANTTYLGRPIFAGSSNAGTAFAAGDSVTLAPYTYSGAEGATVTRRINDTETIVVDADGAATFGSGAASLFASIDSIVQDLRDGKDVSARLAELDLHRENITTQHALVGARYARMEQAQETNLSQSVDLETQRSGIEDADPAKTIIDLKAQELTYQTALAVTARALQPTLLSYLS